jgi:predicted dehydrogenase
MAQAIRVAILGAGKPGVRHAEGFKAAGGYQIAAVADLIPQRRKALMEAFGVAREVADYAELIKDPNIDAVSICLPNHLHLPAATAALRAKKHVICETPPALTAAEAKRIAAAAGKSGKVLLYAAQRRFGGGEQAARQAIEKGYAGEVYHARATWMRTRGIPVGSAPVAPGSPPGAGSGWYADRSKSGGGAVMDLGVQMLDLARDLMGSPRAVSVFAATSDRYRAERSPHAPADVEDTFFALVRFEGGRTLELSAAWAINQPPQQNGTVCRLHGDEGAVDVYTRQGPILYRNFSAAGEAKATLMKLPKLTGYPAMMRHFRECVLGRETPIVGPETGLALMQIVDAIYKSAASGKSVEIKDRGAETGGGDSAESASAEEAALAE